MKLFPNQNFTVELSYNISNARNELIQNTNLTSNIVSKGGVKEDFIEQADQNGVKVIFLIVGFVLCVLSWKV